jgi:hypothetical protein
MKSANAFRPRAYLCLRHHARGHDRLSAAERFGHNEWMAFKISTRDLSGLRSLVISFGPAAGALLGLTSYNVNRNLKAKQEK